MSKTKDKKVCISCQKPKTPAKDFYISYSELHGDKRVPVCKDCLADMYEAKMVELNNPEESIKQIMQKIDKPYFYELLDSSIRENPSNIFGMYMKNAVMPQYKGMTWKDSLFRKVNDEKHVVDNITSTSKDSHDDILDFTLTNEIIRFWGTGYTKEQYMKLVTFKEDMERSYDIETASHKDYLKKICVISLKMDEALANDDINDFKKLSDAYDALMKSAKFTAVQRSAADRTGGLNTFSEFFEIIEKEGFIPKFHTDEPMDIVDQTIDNLKKFTRRLILGDPNIASIVDESLKKINNKEDDEDEFPSSDLDDDIYLDLVEDEEDVYS